jgi:integrase
MAKKRGNGEGSIYKSKDRSGYRASYTVKTAKGSKRRYVSGKTRREVEEKLTKAKAERDGGLVFDAGRLSVGEYLEEWLSNSVRDTVRPSTYKSYAWLVRVHAVPVLGRTKL